MGRRGGYHSLEHFTFGRSLLQEKSKDLAKRMILHWNYSYAIALSRQKRALRRSSRQADTKQRAQRCPRFLRLPAASVTGRLWRWTVSSVIEAGLDSRAGIGPS